MNAIFDMDGLMFDTERVFIMAWDYAGEKMGIGKAGYMVYKTLGMNIVSSYNVWKEEFGDRYNQEELRKYTKEEVLDALNEQYVEAANAVEAKETVLEDLNKQTEEAIQKMVDTEAQKEFMRYAFLKEPKTTIGKIVSGAWRKFKEWWDEHKREAVEKKTRESILGKLAELKKETAEQPRKPIIPRKNRGTELE